MAYVNRSTIRKAIGTALASALTGAQAVYSYQVSDLHQQSPVVRIFSTSSERPGWAAHGIRSKFRVTVQIWVLYTGGTEWTEENAEDALDGLELALITWLGTPTNQSTANWSAIRYDGPSRIGTFNVGGQLYLVEEIDLLVDGLDFG